MKALIIEDDLVMQKIIREIITTHFPEFELLKSAETISEAKAVIMENNPDLVLLDIMLPDGTAFDLLRQIELFDFKLVFMSGHEDYLKEAIQFSAVSFVSKPFDVSDLVAAIDKACEAISESDYQRKMEILLSNADLPALDRVVVFSTPEGSNSTQLSSILYGKAIPGGCLMHLESEKEIYVPRPLRRYEHLFENYSFTRCHPLYVVNLQKVTSIDEMSSTVSLVNGTKLPLEQRKCTTLLQKFREIGLFDNAFSTKG